MWKHWTEHKRHKQMLMPLQREFLPSSKLLSSVTTTLGRWKKKNTSEHWKNSYHVYLCMHESILRDFRVDSKIVLGRKSVCMQECVYFHLREALLIFGPTTMWAGMYGEGVCVFVYKIQGVWESVMRCKCGRTVCGCAASGFGWGFL